MNKKNISNIIIYLLTVIGFWSWFVTGAYFLKSRNAPVNTPTIEKPAANNTAQMENLNEQPATNQINTAVNDAPSDDKSNDSSSVQNVSGVPKTLIIDKLKINTTVEEVGLDKDGNMDIPSSFTSVAWYKLGYKVGVRGSAVLSGHYDTTQGKPAIFWDIKKLEIGDEIKIVDTTNQIYTYKVTGKDEYPYSNLPLQKIFASNNDYMLNLITCSGTWNKTSKNYSTRTVIYSKLIK